MGAGVGVGVGVGVAANRQGGKANREGQGKQTRETGKANRQGKQTRKTDKANRRTLRTCGLPTNYQPTTNELPTTN